MKKNASTTKKEMSNRDKEKNIRTEILEPNIFNFSSKRLSRYRINTLLCDLKFTPTSKCNNIEVKSSKQNYMGRLRLALSCSKTKKETILGDFCFVLKHDLLSPYL